MPESGRWWDRRGPDPDLGWELRAGQKEDTDVDRDQAEAVSDRDSDLVAHS